MKKVFKLSFGNLVFEINPPMTIFSIEYRKRDPFDDQNNVLGWARCHDEDLFDVQTGMMEAYKKAVRDHYIQKSKTLESWIKQQHYSEPIEKFIANRVKRHPDEFERLDNKKLKHDHRLDGNMTSIIELYVNDWFDKENFKASVNKDCSDAINALAKRYPGLTFKLDYEPK